MWGERLLSFLNAFFISEAVHSYKVVKYVT